jgi:hypothetical protein
MGCRCNERRQAIVRIVKASTGGTPTDVGAELQTIVQTFREDATTKFRQSVTQAKASLQRLR